MTFKPLATLSALALSLSVGLGSIAPVQAAPVRIAPVVGDSNVVDVQYRGRRRAARRGYRRGYRDARRDLRRYDRRRYRRNRNGAIIGGVVGGLALGAILAQPRYVAPRYVAPRPVYRKPRRFSAAHHGWCSSRYRSYRAYDGTFQPYNGPRRLCSSPYLR